jgi:thiol-disulfide isomerase/thioredoxin
MKKIVFLIIALLLMLPTAQAELSKNEVLKDMEGVEHKLSNYQGKWVLINYWATWCPPCLEEVPDLVALYDAHKAKDLMVIGVVVDYKTEQAVTKFVDDMLISYPIVLGTSKVIRAVGPAEVLPSSYLYNPQGKLVKVKRGLVTKQYVEELMTAK